MHVGFERGIKRLVATVNWKISVYSSNIFILTKEPHQEAVLFAITHSFINITPKSYMMTLYKMLGVLKGRKAT